MTDAPKSLREPRTILQSHRPTPTLNRPANGKEERCQLCAAVIERTPRGWRHAKYGLPPKGAR